MTTSKYFLLLLYLIIFLQLCHIYHFYPIYQSFTEKTNLLNSFHLNYFLYDKGGFKLKEFDNNRRSFLKNTGKGVGIALGATLASTIPFNYASAAQNDHPSQSNKLQYPFTLGIASGDPLPDGVILWTRLAPDPLNGGGMANHPVPVQWEVSLDATFKNVVKRGNELSKPQLGHSVHVELEGLEAFTWYYYRFKAHDHISPTGRTKTAPAYNSAVDHLNFAFVSCQNWPTGYFTAYQHLAKDDLDLVVHLGDYIYEGNHSSKGSTNRLFGSRNLYA